MPQYEDILRWQALYVMPRQDLPFQLRLANLKKKIIKATLWADSIQTKRLNYIFTSFLTQTGVLLG